MAWKEVSIVVLRRDFVMLAEHPGANIRELCRRFAISPTTGYKWLRRYRQDSQETFSDRSRRPQRSPRRSRRQTEQQMLSVRDELPAWGARKVRARLQTLGQTALPAASTIHAILRRHGGSTRPTRPSISRGSVSSTRPPISCGRWISKGILPWAMEPAVTPRCWTIIHAMPSVCRAAAMSGGTQFSNG